MLTATASNATRVYGDANPALTVAYSGFKNGETASVIDTGATATTTANALSNVGSYATTASGAADTNYDFTYVDGILSVTKAMLTATASNATRIYGDANPALTVAYSGFKNGETDSVITTGATATTGATVLSNVGNYATTASGASASNYDFTYVDGTLGITKATLTATAQNTTRAYGDANPAFAITYTGFKNSDDASVIDSGVVGSSTATAFSNAGTTHAITASGGLDNNYTFTYAPGTLTITKANLVITPQNTYRGYGAANPAFALAYSGFKNGETAGVLTTQPTVSTAANMTSPAGNYAIVASGAASTNYSFTYLPGTLLVLDGNAVVPQQETIAPRATPNWNRDDVPVTFTAATQQNPANDNAAGLVILPKNISDADMHNGSFLIAIAPELVQQGYGTMTTFSPLSQYIEEEEYAWKKHHRFKRL